MFLNMIMSIKQQFNECNSIECNSIELNGTSQRIKHWKSNILFFWWHWYKKFQFKLLKIDKKLHKNIYIYYINYITINKFSDCENIHSVNQLYLVIHSATGYFKEKKRWKIFNYQFDRGIQRSFF